jgi:hypothetical protein
VLGVEAPDACVELGSFLVVNPPGYPFGQTIGIDAGGPARRQKLRTGPRRDGARRDNIIPRSALAEGDMNGGDRIVVELLSPSDMPQVIMIRRAAAFHRGCAHTLSKYRE